MMLRHALTTLRTRSPRAGEPDLTGLTGAAAPDTPSGRTPAAADRPQRIDAQGRAWAREFVRDLLVDMANRAEGC